MVIIRNKKKHYPIKLKNLVLIKMSDINCALGLSQLKNK